MLYPNSIVLTPRAAACGEVVLPGSKSISNRMLLLAALADGVTRLHRVLDSDDTRVMIDSLGKLGVVFGESSGTLTNAGAHPQPNEDNNILEVRGVAGRFPNTGSAQAPLQLFVGNSGLTIRTLVPAIVASLSQTGGCVEIRGVARMHERPIADLVNGLRAIGAGIDYLGEEGFPPLRIRGVRLMPASVITVKGSTSSQFLTGLMQAAPLMAMQWNQPICLEVEGELISKPYIEITRAVL